MSSVATELRSLRSQFPEHRAQLGLSLRVTIAVLSGFAVLHLLKVPLPLWNGSDRGGSDSGDFRQVCEGDHRLSGGHARRRCLCRGRRNTGSPFK
jgi:hypothetical protein